MNEIIDKPVIEEDNALIQAEATPAEHIQPVRSAFKLTVISLVASMVLAEIITMFIGILPGIILYSILLVGLTNLSYFSKVPSTRRLYLAFTLTPILRILSLAMPVQLVSLLYRYVMVGVPLWLSTILVLRFNGLPGLRRNLSSIERISQLIIALSGIPLGIIAYLVLKTPPEIIASPDLSQILLQISIITIFGAISEEVIFRGLIQKALNYPFGFMSFFITSLLYASLFFGTHSIGYLLFYGLTGLLFSLWVQITDSLWGVIVAHSLMNIFFLLLIYLH